MSLMIGGQSALSLTRSTEEFPRDEANEGDASPQRRPSKQKEREREREREREKDGRRMVLLRPVGSPLGSPTKVKRRFLVVRFLPSRALKYGPVKIVLTVYVCM